MTVRFQVRARTIQMQTYQHNDSFLQNLSEYNLTHLPLPNTFLVYRHRMTSRTDPTKWNAALFTSERHTYPTTCWKFQIQYNPCQTLATGMLQTIQDRWSLTSPKRFVVKRETGKLYLTEVSYTGEAVCCAGGQQIPVLQFRNKCVVLSDKFSKLDGSEQSMYQVSLQHNIPIVEPEWIVIRQRREAALAMAETAAEEFLTGSRAVIPPLFPSGEPPARVEQEHHAPRRGQTEPTQTIVTASLPQHIVNSYIQTLLQAGETCPISMEPLTQESSVITPCGHAVSKDAAVHWIQGAHSCPVCRKACTIASLQSWKS
jgi:hypothetical protein